MSSSELEIVRWYTRARKFPQLIGRTPDGTKIPGGPYTFTQVVGAGVILLVGINTMSLWASYGLIGNAVLLLGAAYSGVLLLGRVPLGSRSPLAVSTGAVHALTAPRTGRLAGRPVRVRRPHRIRHQVIALLEEPAAAPFVLPADLAPAPAPTRPARPALSGVQLLLAGATLPPRDC